MKQNEILKQTLLHYIDLEYYANGIDDEFQDLLNELVDRCNAAILKHKFLNTKATYNDIMAIIKGEVSEFQNELEERLEETAETVMNEELDFLDNTYNRTEKGSVAKTAALALGGVTLSRLLFAPVGGKDTTKQFVERTGKNILNSYDTSLRSGYLFGQSSQDVVNQITNKMGQVERGMKNGIITAVPSYAKTTDRIVFLNNNVEVVWVTTLDGRACLTCSSLSGLHFKSIAEAPSIPHFLCRCILFPAKDLTEPVPEFEEFIESLTEEEQKDVLGANRYDLWKTYDIPLNKFLNNGKVITLDELDKDKLVENAKIQKANEETAKLVKKNYPKDTFVSKKITDNSRLYVSKERIKAGIKDPNVYKSDKLMAITLIKKTNRDFYMLAENLVGFANPDGFFIDDTIEMKNVSGSLRRVGLNAVRALRQSKNVFVFVQQDYSIESCLNRIKGALVDTRQQMLKNGGKFIEPEPDAKLLIYTQGKLFYQKWSDVL